MGSADIIQHRESKSLTQDRTPKGTQMNKRTQDIAVGFVGLVALVIWAFVI